MTQTKPFTIPKSLVYEAYKRVKANRGGAGIDGESLKAFEVDLGKNLYKVWNRLSSGSYMPPPVMRVEIEKAGGGVRPLGIPTVSDRIAQMVVKLQIEPLLEPYFHEDSYGYRPGKSAHQALERVKTRCTRRAWVLDMDIQGFFDSIDRELLLKAVHKHIKERWHLLYIERWLNAPVQQKDGRLEYPQRLRIVLERRFESCGLQLHPKKTKVVYCKGGFNRQSFPVVAFDFLGYTFRPRWIKTRRGDMGLYFLGGISQKAAKALRDEINRWPWSYWCHKELVDIRAYALSRLRGWYQYYGLFGKSIIRNVLFHFDKRLSRWGLKKYKKLTTLMQAAKRVNKVRRDYPWAFPHWRNVSLNS